MSFPLLFSISRKWSLTSVPRNFLQWTAPVRFLRVSAQLSHSPARMAGTAASASPPTCPPGIFHKEIKVCFLLLHIEFLHFDRDFPTGRREFVSIGNRVQQNLVHTKSIPDQMCMRDLFVLHLKRYPFLSCTAVHKSCRPTLRSHEDQTVPLQFSSSYSR